MIKQKRGRKAIPDNKKKKPVLIYLSGEQVEMLGGDFETRTMLQQYANYKIKQIERANKKDIGVQQSDDDELLRRFEKCDNKN
jgi:hypothetical protein